MVNSFFCYVIKSAGETAKKVFLSVIWNLMFIEIHLYEISISDSKREKVCAVCPGADSEGGPGGPGPPVRSYDNYNI